MADNSGITSTTGRTSLADSSIFDSKVMETSKENLCVGPTSFVEEEMPQIETRVILVQEAGKQEELIKALKSHWTTSCIKLCTKKRAFAVFMSSTLLYKHDESSTVLYWIQEERRTSQIGDIGPSHGWSYSKRL
ncbi:epithelial cell transforming 2 [Rhinolophus ferrumequinum]|uniref:Epithelial cell transforming 2 n=1 Tax=Rhinolophus ferrumequinum TaxID=59479 RepID=A0A7J8AEJ2_RHIFE|nr:epithelial cell transforming 2 [Rhinolophus ferrumequinum]